MGRLTASKKPFEFLVREDRQSVGDNRLAVGAVVVDQEVFVFVHCEPASAK